MWAVYIILFLIAAVWMTVKAAKRWWEYLIVLGLAAALVVPFYVLTGDVSAVIPFGWSDSLSGKDEIILVSIAATFLWPLFTAALMVWVVKRFQRRGVDQ
jgi:uncharacterized membrane protein